ncbi:MAG TPA: nucleotidyltransferase domain-containing protein [Flavobacterium sp.]|nr:nucleotidyltransferase domain-containing protein [Flavobacterium sp.]
MKLLSEKIEKVKKLCAAHNVETMYLFGSALTSNFKDNSDIDFLVKFKPADLSGYFDNYLHFKIELASLLGRDVDLVEEQTLKNPVLIKSINKNKELIYG